MRKDESEITVDNPRCDHVTRWHVEVYFQTKVNLTHVLSDYTTITLADLHTSAAATQLTVNRTHSCFYTESLARMPLTNQQ